MGAILTGAEIIKAVNSGDIEISDFSLDRVGPNSYDLYTGNKYRFYKRHESKPIDPMDPSTYVSVEKNIPSRGMTIYPGELILVASSDRIHTDKYVPMITGRSSIGRLGLSIHQEAGFGDIGFDGCWTFQLTTIYPIRIYPKMRIAQLYFLTASGDTSILYNGRYNHADGPVESRITEIHDSHYKNSMNTK